MGREGSPAPGMAGSQTPPIIDPENLSEVGGMFEPDGLSHRGQNSITEWAFFEERGRCFEL